MARIVIHNNLSVEEINEKRLLEDFNLTYEERVKKAFNLMKLSILFSKDKTKFKKGIIIKTV